MKVCTLFFTFIALLISSYNVSSQQSNWTLISPSYDNRIMALQGNNLWCVTENDLVRWDIRDMSYVLCTDYEVFEGNLIRSIETAPDSSLWFGTTEGLVHYDNKTWKVYDQHRNVIIMTFDKDGNLWFGSEEGVTVFDGYNWVSYNNVQGVNTIAAGPDKVMWFGNRDGLTRFDGNTWVLYSANDVMQNTYVTSIAFDPYGKVWVGTGGELFWIDGETWYRFETSAVNNIQIDDEGFLWSLNSTGLERYNINTNEWSVYFGHEAVHDTYKFKSYAIDDNNIIYIGSERGLSRYDGEKWTLHVPEEKLPGKIINAVVADNKGNIYFGGKDGVSRFDGGKWEVIYRYPHIYVTVMTIGFDGDLWIGTHGVSRYNGRTWTSYTTHDGLANNSIYALDIDSDGNVWAGTLNGISCFQDNKWKTYTTLDGLPDNEVIAIASHDDGIIWCGTYGGGLCYFDGNEWKTDSSANILLGNNISLLEFSIDGNLWATSENGVFFRVNEKWTEVEHAINFVTDGNGEIWIGTDEGILNKYNRKEKILQYNEKFWDRYISSTAFDNDGKVWVGTSVGVFIYDPSQSETEIEKNMPENIAIKNNYPNPFNPTTTIEFDLPETGMASLTIYNIAGQKVRELLTGYKSAGKHRIVWDGTDENGNAVSAGVYIARLKAGEVVAMGKMVLIR